MYVYVCAHVYEHKNVYVYNHKYLDASFKIRIVRFLSIFTFTYLCNM